MQKKNIHFEVEMMTMAYHQQQKITRIYQFTMNILRILRRDHILLLENVENETANKIRTTLLLKKTSSKKNAQTNGKKNLSR